MIGELSQKYGTEKRQKELLEMITDIDSIFRNHSISYSLCGGTLIGAIREKGFIPWDDDIDIMVDRNNLHKIIKLFSTETTVGYVLERILWIRRIHKINNKGKGMSASTIDIFVVDNVPDNFVIRNTKLLLIKLLQGMMKVKVNYSNYSLFYKICIFFTRVFGKLFSYEKKFLWYDTVSQIGNESNTAYVSIYNDLYKYISLRYSNKLLQAYKYIQFENVLLPITLEYDNYLTTAYGDYMTPPKEEDRVPEHL